MNAIELVLITDVVTGNFKIITFFKLIIFLNPDKFLRPCFSFLELRHINLFTITFSCMISGMLFTQL